MSSKPRARRPNGEGSVRQKSDGTWSVRISVRDPQTGRPVRREIYGGTTRDAAEAKRIRLLADRLDHVPYHPNTVTLGRYLDTWVGTLTVRPSTRESYAGRVAAWRADAIASKRIGSITPADLRDAMGRIGERYSPATAAHALTVLRIAFRAAEREGVIRRNVARLVDGPTVPRRAMSLPTDAELAHLGPVIAADPYRALYLLAIHAAMRAGEILALTWGDLSPDLDAVVVHASMGRDRRPGLTKSGRSRTLPLHPDVTLALREHRQRLVDTGVRPLLTAYVFLQSDGRPFTTPTLRHRWRRLCTAAGVRAIRFHDLRHLGVTRMIAAGTPLEDVSRYAGHASIGITGDLYYHPDLRGVRWGASLPTIPPQIPPQMGAAPSTLQQPRRARN